VDLRHQRMLPATQTLGLPVLNRNGDFLGTVHAVVDEAVPGRDPYLVLGWLTPDGGHRFGGFLLREFECRRHGLGDYLVLPVDPQTLEELPGIDPSLLIRGEPAGPAAARRGTPVRRRRAAALV
jgi:hypothetical protein